MEQFPVEIVELVVGGHFKTDFTSRAVVEECIHS